MRKLSLLFVLLLICIFPALCGGCVAKNQPPARDGTHGCDVCNPHYP